VDAGERSWADAIELRSGAQIALGRNESSSRLSNTRWTATEQDFSLIGSIDSGVLRSTLANALIEVGVFEKGSEREKRQIVQYWGAAGPEWSKTTVNDLSAPWGGAFLAWIVRQSGAQPPNSPASFFSWQKWGDDVPPILMTPGMIAVFKLDIASELPQARSRLLVGVFVRRQAGCIEIIAGNIADRVVITCVAENLLDTVRRPRLL
jgi:hypothetical protein